eukprot:5797980-Prymnesium_polylepis.2
MAYGAPCGGSGRYARPAVPLAVSAPSLFTFAAQGLPNARRQTPRAPAGAGDLSVELYREDYDGCVVVIVIISSRRQLPAVRRAARPPPSVGWSNSSK